jgi:hypothetical protein
LVEPDQFFYERDTSDRAHVLLSGVASNHLPQPQGPLRSGYHAAPGMIPAFPLPVLGIL